MSDLNCSQLFRAFIITSSRRESTSASALNLINATLVASFEDLHISAAFRAASETYGQIYDEIN